MEALDKSEKKTEMQENREDFLADLLAQIAALPKKDLKKSMEGPYKKAVARELTCREDELCGAEGTNIFKEYIHSGRSMYTLYEKSAETVELFADCSAAAILKRAEEGTLMPSPAAVERMRAMARASLERDTMGVSGIR